jgi:cell division protein FtsW
MTTSDVSTEAARTSRPPRGRSRSRGGSQLRWAQGSWTTDAAAITALTLLLVVFGLVMSLSASFVDAATAEGTPFAVFYRQLVWASLGLAGFVAAVALDHRIWRPLSWLLLLAGFVGLVLLFVPGVSHNVQGATRWLQVGPIRVQPTELVKLATLLWLAEVLERKRPRDGRPHTVPHLLVPALPLLVVLAALVMAQPDLGTTILLALIVGAVLWVEGLPGRFVAAMAVAGVAAVVSLSVVAPYRMARFTGWLAPEEDPLGSGFQLLQSWYALGSGGLFGVGLGSSRGKWSFLPNPETDFIFAIIGEELGLVGTLSVVALFGVLLYLGLRVAYASPHGFSRTVAFAITAWVIGQALINVGTVIGLLPITGVTLPLLSVGGSSLVTTLVALGILVSIARDVPPPAPTRRPRPARTPVRLEVLDGERPAAASEQRRGTAPPTTRERDRMTTPTTTRERDPMTTPATPRPRGGR